MSSLKTSSSYCNSAHNSRNTRYALICDLFQHVISAAGDAYQCMKNRKTQWSVTNHEQTIVTAGEKKLLKKKKQLNVKIKTAKFLHVRNRIFEIIWTSKISRYMVHCACE